MSSDDEIHFPAIAILGERRSRYLVQWDGRDETGKPWPDSWEPKSNVTDDLVSAWKAKKADTKTKKKLAKQRARTGKPTTSRQRPVALTTQPGINSRAHDEVETFIMQSVPSTAEKRKSRRVSRAQAFFQSSPGSPISPATTPQIETQGKRKASGYPQKRPRRCRRLVVDSDVEMDSPGEEENIPTKAVGENDSLSPHSSPYSQLRYPDAHFASPSAAHSSISRGVPDNYAALHSPPTKSAQWSSAWPQTHRHVAALAVANPNKGIKARMRPRDPEWRGLPF
ncbi:hypothetical protein B0H15DRAFT_951390 [Mycena belliarum]|uniref:Chromo domain-containing protein n=1 Tax=Mycena belliarum TaxID=1033014 RepID=A0AAD6U4Z4_9AGAR|nr:hypothetical protein B0H15DRAFT_951390 [Mycena belliae]